MLPFMVIFHSGHITHLLLHGAGALAVQALRACGPNGVAVACSMASGGGVPTDDELTTGLEMQVMMVAGKGLDLYGVLPPKAVSGTKEDPNLVSSITNKSIAGCICEEDNSTQQQCPSCGTHYKLLPHQVAH
uniref:Cytochrome c oxidase subunit 5B, mitochondrial n=1 Tax=Theropithecus gelada TaxID=9565 RepID=A0A8D2F031_THEGE